MAVTMETLFVLLAVLIAVSVVGIMVSVVAAVRMCINRQGSDTDDADLKSDLDGTSSLTFPCEEPFEPLQEEDYDDLEVQIELKEAMEI